MSKPPFSIFALTEDQAISLLATDPEQLEDPADRYIAASQLANHPSDRTIAALSKAIQVPSFDLNSRIVRRKAVESLGYLKAKSALPLICTCLADEDNYTVQNAVWSIGEIGTQNDTVLEAITILLTKPDQNHRLVIQTLAKLGYYPAVDQIRQQVDATDLAVSSAAISALYQLTGDQSQMPRVVELLQNSSVNARRSCIQDLIDAKQYTAIPAIARCSVSMVFRLRAIRLLAEVGMPAAEVTFAQIEPALEQILRDHPNDLDLVHEYDQPPELEFVLKELYETDFSRCYLATQTLLKQYPTAAPTALINEFSHKAKGDYGAHYHGVKLLGWLRHAPAYDLLIEALHNPAPQFQKSRTAAAIALGNLGDRRAIPELKASANSEIWSLNYACLMALQQLKEPVITLIDPDSADFLIRAKWLGFNW